MRNLKICLVLSFHLISLVSIVGCGTSSDSEVIVYAALDEQFSGPVLEDFEAETGVDVRANFDVESTKTIGLVNKIVYQQNRPVCDVFWNNEIVHTLRLQKLGLLETYVSPVADPFPPQWKSSEGYWHGLAARARVLIVNTSLVSPAEMPTSIQDLIDSKWRGKVGMAKPAYGTTASHAAVLFAMWGDEKAKEFFRQIKANVSIVSGNKQVAQDVSNGRLAFGITDTDDAIIELEHSLQGQDVQIIFPDQGAGEMGTLLIPNSLCLVKNSPNPDNARQLIDYLLQPPVERQLCRGQSAQVPLSTNVSTTSRALAEQNVKWMDVDFAAAADKWDITLQFLSQTFAIAN